MEATIAVIIEGRKFTTLEQLQRAFVSGKFWPAPLPRRPWRKAKMSSGQYSWAYDIFAKTSYYKDLFVREGAITPEDTPPIPEGCSIIILPAQSS